MSEEQNEDPSSELLGYQQDSSTSDYSESELLETSVIPLDQLREERGGVLFSDQEISDFLELLSNRFNFTDMQVNLTYVEPEKQARKLCKLPKPLKSQPNIVLLCVQSYSVHSAV